MHRPLPFLAFTLLLGCLATAEAPILPETTGFLDAVSAETQFEPGPEGVCWPTLKCAFERGCDLWDEGCLVACVDDTARFRNSEFASLVACANSCRGAFGDDDYGDCIFCSCVPELSQCLEGVAAGKSSCSEALQTAHHDCYPQGSQVPSFLCVANAGADATSGTSLEDLFVWMYGLCDGQHLLPGLTPEVPGASLETVGCFGGESPQGSCADWSTCVWTHCASHESGSLDHHRCLIDCWAELSQDAIGQAVKVVSCIAQTGQDPWFDAGDPVREQCVEGGSR